MIMHRSTDISATINPIPSGRVRHRGQRARSLDRTSRKDGEHSAAPLWSSVAVLGSSVLDIEVVRTQRDVEFDQAASDARSRAPIGRRHLDEAWLLRHSDGLGRSARSCLRVWIAGWKAVEMVVFTNLHVGVEYLGAPRPVDYCGVEASAYENTRFALSA